MAATSHPTGAFGHPRGLMTLFFTEMWERFSYYGMRAFLVLYITTSTAKGGLGESDATGGIIYAMYGSLAYLLGVPGGWLADRFLGQRKAVLIGGIIIMLGHITLALPTGAAFYPGLGLIVLGTGLLKPNVSTIVGQLYAKDDVRRDAGYTIFYMGINLGAAVAPFICGFMAKTDTFRGWLVDRGIDPNASWHFGFGAAAVGMAFGVLQFWRGQKHLGEAGLRPHRPEPVPGASTGIPPAALAIAGGAAAIVAAFWIWRLSDGVDKAGIADGFGVTLLTTAIALFLVMHKVVARDVGERRRVRAMAVLFFGCMAFFGVFEQAGSSINLFTDRFVERELFFVEFDATYYQSVNAAWILLLGPVFAWLWIRLAKARKEPDAVKKFALGVLLSGVAFLPLIPQVAEIALGHRISGAWLVFGYYLIITCAELCLSPVGLSVMNRLAPDRLAGFVMGIWFLAISLGYYIAGRASTEVGKIANHLEWGPAVTVIEGDGQMTTTHTAGIFYLLIIGTTVISAALWALSGPVKRMLAASEADELPAAKAEDKNAL